MLAADLESRFEEWRRWALSGRHHRGQAGSAEGAYRSPQHWELVTHAPGMPLVVWRAYQIEVVVTALLNPWREVLRLHYIVRATPETIRRVLRRGWRVQDHLLVLEEARRRVAAGLDCSARPRSRVPSYVGLPAHV